MACVARQGEELLNALAGGLRVVAHKFRSVGDGVAPPHALENPVPEEEDVRCRAWAILPAEAAWWARTKRVLTAKGLEGRRRSRMGGNPLEIGWRRMLSWMKRLAVAGASAHRSRGIEGL